MENIMPKSVTCLHGDNILNVDNALKLVVKAKSSGHAVPDLCCVECGKPVRPHNSGGKAMAHFEHFKANPNCPLSCRFREQKPRV